MKTTDKKHKSPDPKKSSVADLEQAFAPDIREAVKAMRLIAAARVNAPLARIFVCRYIITP